MAQFMVTLETCADEQEVKREESIGIAVDNASLQKQGEERKRQGKAVKEESVTCTYEQIESMIFRDLKEAARKLRLSIVRNKQTLTNRLKDAIEDEESEEEEEEKEDKSCINQSRFWVNLLKSKTKLRPWAGGCFLALSLNQSARTMNVLQNLAVNIRIVDDSFLANIKSQSIVITAALCKNFSTIKSKLKGKAFEDKDKIWPRSYNCFSALSLG
ncbi:hypothetical protein M0802_016159 [Mischocyttarus mexicanus]|nr:hypothetical protein M0802_016159 [Mischocyttarus mexicanus]